MDLLERMLSHDLWATQYLLGLCGDLTDDELDQQFDIGHGSLRDTYIHFVFNIDYWMTAMHGQPRPAPTSRPSVAELLDHHQRSYPLIAEFARQIWAEERQDETFLDHYQAPQTYSGAIIQFIYHNNEHRTEIIHLLARLGKGEIETDYGLWDFVRRGLA